MTQAELEQTGAQLAQELKAAVEQGTITSRQMEYFKIADVQRVIRDKRLSPREATDRLRFYQKLANGLKAGTLSGDEVARRIQTFNVMGDADASKNWVSGVWVSEGVEEDDPDKNLALFASTSGEIALGFLCTYTINEDKTVKDGLHQARRWCFTGCHSRHVLLTGCRRRRDDARKTRGADRRARTPKRSHFRSHHEKAPS